GGEGKTGKDQRCAFVSPVPAKAGKGVVEGGEALRAGAGEVQGVADAEAVFLPGRAGAIPERGIGRDGVQPIAIVPAEIEAQAERGGRGQVAGQAVEPFAQAGRGQLTAQGRDQAAPPAAIRRSAGRSSLPVALRGRRSTNSNLRGRAALDNWRRAWASTSSGVASPTTRATTRSPHTGSGWPVTATSRTPGQAARQDSTASGWTLWPPLISMSSARPVTVSRPSASIAPRSPLVSQPSASTPPPSR